MRFLSAVRPGSIDVAVDVGAALGSYSWILSRLSHQVYAFEPGAGHSAYLGRVVFGTNIRVIRAAVGGSCRRVTLYTPGVDRNALHSATLSRENPVSRETGTRVEEVDQITLDAFFVDKLPPGRSVDVIKVDVEGYELEVFTGSLQTLAAYHPLIICEIEARHNPNYAAAFRVLKDLGYGCYIFRAGAFESFADDRIEGLQLEADLRIRTGRTYDPDSNRYINNFVFQHPRSRIKVKA